MQHKLKKTIKIRFTEHEAEILEELLSILSKNHWWDENLHALTKINGNKLKKLLDTVKDEEDKW